MTSPYNACLIHCPADRDENTQTYRLRVLFDILQILKTNLQGNVYWQERGIDNQILEVKGKFLV